MTVTQAWAGYITKAEKDPTTGHLMVYGKASGPDLDLDGQIADPRWLRKAMPDWMVWGNVREMHRPSAAGVGKELSAAGDDWNLKALVVDPVAADKVETGVYKGFSIGIKDPKVIRDATAPGGRIVGGTVIEVSLVDRPCNPTATMGIAKAYGAELGPVEWAGEVVGKAADEPDDGGAPLVDDFAGDEVDASDDPAVPDEDDELLADAAAKAARTVAVEPVEDDLPIFTQVAQGGKPVEIALDTAQAYLAERGIMTPSAYRRAVATVSAVLGGTVTKRKIDESADIAGAQAVIAQLAALIISEATELAAGRMSESDDIACLMDAVRAVRYFMQREQRQDGTEVPDATDDSASTEGGMAWVGLGAEADATKRAFTAAERADAADSGAAMSDGSYPIKTRDDLSNAIHAVGRGKGDHGAIRRHIIARARALGLSAMIPDGWSGKAAESDGATQALAPDLTKMIDDAVAEATAVSEGRIKTLEAQLAKVLAAPVPGGPFIMPVTTRPAMADDQGSRARNLIFQAERASDPAVAHAYRAAAARATGSE
jgi:hypothetical protein